MLLRPRGPAFQVLAQEQQLMRVGASPKDCWCCYGRCNPWRSRGPRRASRSCSSPSPGCVPLSGLFVLQGTLCFWTIESLEVVNCATYGGVGVAQFPLTIDRTWFRHIFTFSGDDQLLPRARAPGSSGFVGQHPTHAVARPGAGLVFLLGGLRVWRIGVRRYTSTGN